MSLFATFAAASTETKELNFIPEQVEFAALGGAGTHLTKLTIEADDIGTIVNLDENGIKTFMGADFTAGRSTDVVNGGRITIADGKIPLLGNSCRFVGTNGTNATPIYQQSFAPKGKVLMKKTMATILAGSQYDLTDFSAVGLVNLAATDLMTLEYANGHVEQNLAPEQVASIVASLGYGNVMYPDLNTTPANRYNPLPNYDGIFSKVTIIPAANTIIYIEKMVPVFDAQSQ